MSNRKPNLDRSHLEVVETITEGVRVQAEKSEGVFKSDTLGFSSVVEVRGAEGLRYTRYSGLADMSLRAFVNNFDERILKDAENRMWFSEIDVFALVNGTLRYLREAGHFTAMQGVEANG